MKRKQDSKLNFEPIESDPGFSLEEMEAYLEGTANPEVAATIELMRKTSAPIDQEFRLLQYDPIEPVFVESSSASTRSSFFRGMGLSGVAASAFLAILMVRQPYTSINTIEGVEVLSRDGKMFTFDQVDLKSLRLASGIEQPSSKNWKAVWLPGQTKAGSGDWVRSETDTTISGSDYELMLIQGGQDGPSGTDVSIEKDGAVIDTLIAQTETCKIHFSSPGVYTIRLTREQPNRIVEQRDFRLRVMDQSEQALYNQKLDAASSNFQRLDVFADFGFTAKFADLKKILTEKNNK